MSKIMEEKKGDRNSSDDGMDEADLESMEEENSGGGNRIFDEYYEWEPNYRGDDVPTFDQFMKHKNWIEEFERN